MTSRGWTMLLLLVAAVLYFGSLDTISLTEPDEVFYSLTAREMIEHNSYMTPLIFGHPQFEKPPLFYWLLIASFKMFGGATPLAARLIPALCGFFGVIATFYFCRRVFNQHIAWCAAILLATSALYLGMSKAVLTDITVSVLITVAFYAFYLWFLERRDKYLYAFALASGLAVLTKGPIAITILIIATVMYLAVIKDLRLIRTFLVHPWVLVFVVVCVPWYIQMIVQHGATFIDEFIVHDNWHRILRAEHQNFDRWWFYPMIVAIGLFPWMFYMVYLGRQWENYRREFIFFILWFAVAFVIFQSAHSKLASYILPAMPAVIIPLAVSMDGLVRRDRRMAVLSGLYAFLGIAILLTPCLLDKLFPHYMWTTATVAIRVLGVGVMVAAVLLWKGRLFPAVMAKAAGMTAMFFLIGWHIPSSIDRAVSDAYLRDIVAEEYSGGETIVTNKLFSRGIYFQTGHPVVIMDHNKQPFWSPHPIDVISNEAEIRAFFDGRRRVICVLKKSYADEIARIFKNERDYRVIAKDGSKVVFVSDRLIK